MAIAMLSILTVVRLFFDSLTGLPIPRTLKGGCELSVP